MNKIQIASKLSASIFDTSVCVSSVDNGILCWQARVSMEIGFFKLCLK